MSRSAPLQGQGQVLTGQRGVVVSFDSDRGFGFVRVTGFPEEVFLHVSDVRGHRRVRPGQRLTLDILPSDRGPRAVRVVPGRAGLTPALAAALGLVAFLAVTLVGLRALGAPWWLCLLLPLNTAAFAAFAEDKRRAARTNHSIRRIPESVLLGLAAVGGSLGGLAAMLGLRHKTRKTRFLVPFALVLLAQVAFLIAWFAR